MPTPTLTVHLAPPVFSWCDTCMKSTAYSVRLYSFTSDAIVPMGQIHGCVEMSTHESGDDS